MKTFKQYFEENSYDKYFNDTYGVRHFNIHENIINEQNSLYEGLISSYNADKIKSLFNNIGINDNDIKSYIELYSFI